MVDLSPGVINEDKLGLGKIYLQAKRYARDNLVGSPEIQTFIGALQNPGSKKGNGEKISKFNV